MPEERPDRMQAWELFLQLQEQDLGVETVRRWLRTLKIKSFDARNLYLEAKDSFQIMWFEEHVRDQLTDNLLNNNRRPISVHLSLSGVPEQAPPRRQRRTPKESQSDEFVLEFEQPDPSCLFEHLIVNEKNLLAYRVLAELQEKASTGIEGLTVFNPVYLYGRSGSGKTHLLMATAQALQKHGVNVVYVSAKTFTHHVVKAIRAGQMPTFRRHYRQRDVLIVDDIDTLSGKTSTQEEFFHTFNTLHLAGKQIVIAGRQAPRDLSDIAPRLVSRFEWGVVVPLETFAREERIEVLKAKSKALRFPLTFQLEEFLCQTFTRSSKSLCAALEALSLRLHLQHHRLSASRSGSHVTLATVRTLLADFIAEEQRSEVKPEKVLAVVADVYGVNIEDILGKGQSRELSKPRQVAMYLCRDLLKMPYKPIGRVFSRDHSTVMSSVRQVVSRMEDADSDLASEVEDLKKKLIV